MFSRDLGGDAVETVCRSASGKAGLLEAAAQTALAGGVERAERKALRPGLSVERAADLLWTICAQANYDRLVTSRGWSRQDYRDWLGDTLIATLLPGP